MAGTIQPQQVAPEPRYRILHPLMARLCFCRIGDVVDAKQLRYTRQPIEVLLNTRSVELAAAEE